MMKIVPDSIKLCFI